MILIKMLFLFICVCMLRTKHTVVCHVAQENRARANVEVPAY